MSPQVALYLAVALFAALALAEVLRPDRAGQYRRWPLNIGLGLVGLLIVRVLAIVAPVGAALWAQGQGIGLLNIAAVPTFAAGLVTIVAMDFLVYWQHRAFHHVPWFWRWHKLHHRDEALDLSTGLRFHPAEAVLSMVWKSACVVALGAPVWAVPLFELWLMAGSMIEHANIRLPARVDAAVRRLMVTPAMHRVHHSAHSDDANHNFSFAISAWDKLFRSYRAVPSGPRIGTA
jgi:sterol desaturase/sphingolipid hydroxylase (fatty acid hydroxylase superfamily)